MAVSITTRAGKGSALTHAEMDTNLTNINGALMPVGTVAMFIQAAAPSGWTQDNTYNDKVIRLIDNTGTGASTGGSWTISGVTTDDHALTIQELPSHSHGIQQGVGVGSPYYVEYFDGNSSLSRTTQTTNTGGDQGHNHGVSSDGTWRPSYVDAIVCTKD